MRVLIVGSTSAIGTAIGRDLGRDGVDVVTAGRRAGDLTLDLAAPVAVERVVGDLRCDVVVNAAVAIGGPDPARAAEARTVNVEGAAEVARVSDAVGARHLIHLSTAYVAFPDRYVGPPSYPETKAAGEVRVAEVADACDLPLTILRLTHVYDAEGACRPNQELPYHFADQASANASIELHGDGSAHRDFLHLDDALAAVGLAITGGVTGTLTIGSPRMPTIAETACAARRAFGSTAPIRFRADRPGPPSMPPIEPDGWDRLGGAPRVDIGEGFVRMREARGR